MNDLKQLYPTPKLIGIFDAKVLIDINEGEDYLCAICRNICDKPMDIGCEKAHVYCNSCLTQYIQHNPDHKTCILCKDNSFILNENKIIHNKFVEKQINKLKVRCLYSFAVQQNNQSQSEEGMIIDDTQHRKYCCWVGIFADLSNHINDCKYKAMYHMIPCSYFKFGCKQYLKEMEMSNHVKQNAMHHLELKMNHQFNAITSDQNDKIKRMQKRMDTQSIALELAKYKYIALTIDGSLTAFNTNSNSSYKLPLELLSIDRSSRLVCKYNDHEINRKLFPSLRNIHHSLNIFYRLAKDDNIAYCLETSESKILPPFDKDSCSPLFTEKHGLMNIGGFDTEQNEAVRSVAVLIDTNEEKIDEKEQMEYGRYISEKQSEQSWERLTEMDVARFYPSACEIDIQYLFVAGGDTGTRFLNTCDLYNYKSGKWDKLANMKHVRRSGGCCYWKERNNIVIVGGYNRKEYMKKVEIYDINKDKWLQLPDTTYGHAGAPNVSMCYDVCNNGIIFVAGVLTADMQDMIECYDIRDSRKQWHNVCDIATKVGFRKVSGNYSKRRLCSVFSI